MKTIPQLLTIAVSFFGVTYASAQIEFQHLGITHPAAEGWEVIGPGPATSAGAVTNDLGFGIDAWNVNDSSSVNGSNLGYRRNPTDAQVARAGTVGWRLSAYVRVVRPSDAPDSSAIVEYSNGARTFSMDFGSDADGDPRVVLRTGFAGAVTLGPSFTLEGVGSSYHLFDLIYDPVSGAAELFVDGVPRIGDYRGDSANDSSSMKRVVWGAWGSGTQGNINYSRVEWEITTCPPFTSIRVSEVEINWPSQSNRLYRVDYRSTLTTDVWAPLFTDIVGNGATMSVLDKLPAGQPHRFYRVLCQPE